MSEPTMELTTIEPNAVKHLEQLQDECAILRMAENSITKVLQSAEAVKKLETALQYKGVMDAIMELQGKPIGFLTDRDAGEGYPAEVVRQVTITAMMNGAYMINNEVNIISGRAYFTQGFFKRKLAELDGLNGRYKMLPNIPTLEGDEARVSMFMEWTHNGEKGSDTLVLPIKVNKGMGSDAIIGKALRKSCKWLYEYLTKIQLVDGDVSEDDLLEIAPSAADAESAKAKMLAAAKPSELEHPPDDMPLGQGELISEDSQGTQEGGPHGS